jgi:hypothetical protein
LTSTFKSTASQDGWVLETTEISGEGGEFNTTQETLSVGDYSTDKKQARGILSFNINRITL